MAEKRPRTRKQASEESDATAPSSVGKGGFKNELNLIPEEVSAMTDVELIKAMRALNYNPGPINIHSRSLYERLYVRLLKDNGANVNPAKAEKAIGKKAKRAQAENAAPHVVAEEFAAVAAAVADPGEDGEQQSSQVSTVVESIGEENGAHDTATAAAGSVPVANVIAGHNVDVEAAAAAVVVGGGQSNGENPVETHAANNIQHVEEHLASALQEESLPPADLPPLPAAAAPGTEELEPLFSGAEDAPAVGGEAPRSKVYRKAKGGVQSGQGGLCWVPLLMLLLAVLTVAVFGPFILNGQ